MPLPVAYQNQFNSVCVRGYWLPESCHEVATVEAVFPDKPEARRAGIQEKKDWIPVLTDPKRLCESVCNAREDSTLSAITSPAMRHQKTWSFILTRMVLGEILQQDPKTIEIDRVGKPRLVESVILGKSDVGTFVEDDGSNERRLLHFNVSHSANLWVIAWSFDQEVGIDVQKIDESIHYSVIMRQFFTASERAKVTTVFDFFDIWTQKEALLKLEGLSFAHMPKISTENADIISLDIDPTFKSCLAFK
jgi:phosphopantetheinyl transferase